MAINRREAREAAFSLLFETEFRRDELCETIFETSCENREIGEDAYLRRVYFGVCEHREQLDEAINRHARGWNMTRISRVSRSILRLSAFELLYCEDIPNSVSINEAVELCKKFDEDAARPFVNGVLNGIKDEIAAGGHV